MEIPSFKKNIIHQYSLLSSADGMEKNYIILATATGIIKGRIIPPNEAPITDTSTVEELLLNVAEECAKNYRSDNQIPDNQMLPGSDGGISLKDVSIKLSYGTFSAPFLFVFYDQIIGVSVGNF